MLLSLLGVFFQRDMSFAGLIIIYPCGNDTLRFGTRDSLTALLVYLFSARDHRACCSCVANLSVFITLQAQSFSRAGSCVVVLHHLEKG